MVRYHGTLHKLVDSATSSNSRTNWSQVLHYLEGHTVSNSSKANPPHDSPLPPYTAPSVDLEVELYDMQGPKRDETPLRLAVKAAPAEIVGALCHLGPQAARMKDSRDRLPLHWVLRRSSKDPETNKILRILVAAFPEGLLQRDDAGRTPLHWLFWYHAASRTPEICEIMCREIHVSHFEKLRQPDFGVSERYPLPEIPKPSDRAGIPANALIVSDARHGALPLHYAVMQGATKEVVKYLLHSYPASRAETDRKGRTALAWYFGAGYLLDARRHICGETNDPHATPWWETKLSTTIIQMLVSSRTARIVDDTGRTPLHWACHLMAKSQYMGSHGCMALKVVQTLLDNHIEALTARDKEGKTPLQLYFDVVVDLQAQEHERQLANGTLRDNLDLINGGPIAFEPPLELMELLLKSPQADGGEEFDRAYRFESEKPVSAAACETPAGGLPLHSAVAVATSSQVVKLLIQANPTGLVHATEENLQTPLIHALMTPYAAPMQSFQTIELLLQAYVTSRHGTYMDGRLSLKMEDSFGKYPLHYAAENHAALDVLKLLVEKFPRSTMFQNSDGDLPVHSLLSKEHLFAPPESGLALGASLAQPLGFLTEKEVAWQKQVQKMHKEKIQILTRPLLTSSEHLQVADKTHGMTPLHVVVAFDALGYDDIFCMLDAYPEAAGKITTRENYNFSCMDLHEMHKNESEDIEEWTAIRELLFAFCPTIDAYRSKEELLDDCVKLIRAEALGEGSYHSMKTETVNQKRNNKLTLAETLSAIEPPDMNTRHKPKTVSAQEAAQAVPEEKSPKPREAPPPRSKRVAKKRTKKRTIPRKTPEIKSIYDDDDLGGCYSVSSERSDSESDYYSDDGSEYSAESEELTYRDSIEIVSTMGSTVGSSSVYTGKGTTIQRDPTEASSIVFFDEKKEEMMDEQEPLAKRTREGELKYLSEVAMRLWCFFVLYNNRKDPGDSYLKQVEAVLDDIDFEIVERLISLPVPDYAQVYLPPGTSIAGVTLRDVASPRPKALFHSFEHFLGRYEFPDAMDGVVLHQSSDGNTVFVRAFEHFVSTEQFREGVKLAPGTAEESIWGGGEMLYDEKDYMESTFQLQKRNVYFKLMKNEDAFVNEVACRERLESNGGTRGHVVPLVNTYEMNADKTRDKRYRRDTHDERFQVLPVQSNKSIVLSDFPYALVFPLAEDGDLFDYSYHHGVEDLDNIRDISCQVGQSLKFLHSSGIVHGSLSPRSISKLPSQPDDMNRQHWVLANLSTAIRLGKGPQFSCAISHDGSARFSSGLLPPEMFVKLNAGEARMYKKYWEAVEEEYGVTVDKSVVQPQINLESGATFVLRCHYVPKASSSEAKALPPLPYSLVPVRENFDHWCLGRLIFFLCSGGRDLCPVNHKTGHLLDYEHMVNWNSSLACSTIYENVADPAAQDLLRKLLADYETRSDLTLETILSHPFFKDSASRSFDDRKLIQDQVLAFAGFERRRSTAVAEKSEDEWLHDRTTIVDCWDFKMLRQMNFSSSHMTRGFLGRSSEALAMPGAFMILPYKLSAMNKKGRLAPVTKSDVEKSERLGVAMLELSKACRLGAMLNDAIAGEQAPWTAAKLLDRLPSLPDSFNPLKEEISKLAAGNVEVFRQDPGVAAKALILKRVNVLKSLYLDGKDAYIYFVDEMTGVPVALPDSKIYPYKVGQNQVEAMLLKVLPFMLLCSVCGRGAARSLGGLVKQLFEAAYPHIPPSWTTAGSGLANRLDDSLLREVKTLHMTLTSVSSATGVADPNDELSSIRDFILKQDVRRTFADMVRVSCGQAAFWTTKESCDQLAQASESYGFKEALELQLALETKLAKQEQTIKKLEEEIEKMSFRKKLDLDVPELEKEASDANVVE